MSLIRRFFDFIDKETVIENESRKMTVLLRKLAVLIMLYLIFGIAFCAVIGIPNGIASNVMCLFVFLIVFWISYNASRNVTMWSFQVAAIMWSVISLWLYGWFCGVQTFLLLLILIFYFSVYNRYGLKVVASFVVFLIYMALFFMFADRDVGYVLSNSARTILRCGFMAILIVSVSLVAYTFSSESQEMESKLIEYNKKLKEKATTDPLTGLYNRGMAVELMDKLVARANDETFSLCICDIDLFKRVNDNYGHDIGDMVLRQVADAMLKVMDGNGFAARWGGEEFMLVFPGTNGDIARDFIYDIQQEISKRYVMVRDIKVQVTMTFGLNEFDSNKTLDENLKEADEKLYLGKEQGRNRMIY